MEFLFASFSKAISRLDDKTGTRFNAHIIFIGYNALSPCKIGLLFYHDFSILREADADVKAFRLLLSAHVARVVKTAMSLLGIQVPDRM